MVDSHSDHRLDKNIVVQEMGMGKGRDNSVKEIPVVVEIHTVQGRFVRLLELPSKGMAWSTYWPEPDRWNMPAYRGGPALVGVLSVASTL